jgi:anti-sigma regulatory factor (Ser/Thr protein kinase)
MHAMAVPSVRATTSAYHWPLRSYLKLGVLPSAAPHARQHTSQMLRKWDLGELGKSAELVVSELITNAIQASCQVGGDNYVRLWLFSDRARVVIQVWDNCPDPPQPTPAGPTDEDGRGLLLVEAMTTSWDWYSQDEGKIVWAVLQFSPLLRRNDVRKPPDFRSNGRRAAVTMLPAAPARSPPRGIPPPSPAGRHELRVRPNVTPTIKDF